MELNNPKRYAEYRNNTLTNNSYLLQYFELITAGTVLF